MPKMYDLEPMIMDCRNECGSVVTLWRKKKIFTLQRNKEVNDD